MTRRAASDRIARLLGVHRVAAARADDLSRANATAADEHSRLLVETYGAERAALIASGVGNEREAQAARNREAVERMSREGRRVAEIAVALGISRSHVVALRARLGVGRRR